jgi:hypothetical protein
MSSASAVLRRLRIAGVIARLLAPAPAARRDRGPIAAVADRCLGGRPERGCELWLREGSAELEYVERADSPRAYRELFKQTFGPVVAIYQTLADQPDRLAAVDRDFLEFATRLNRGMPGGPRRVPLRVPARGCSEGRRIGRLALTVLVRGCEHVPRDRQRIGPFFMRRRTSVGDWNWDLGLTGPLSGVGESLRTVRRFSSRARPGERRSPER